MSSFTSSSSAANSKGSPGNVFCESIVQGAGFAIGGAVVGAVLAVLFFPAPGSAEAGAEIGRKIGGMLGGSGAC